MIKIMIVSLAASVVLLAIALRPVPPPRNRFDPLIDNRLIEGACRNEVPFSIHSDRTKRDLHYTVEFDLNTDDDWIRYSTVIRIRGARFSSPPGGWRDGLIFHVERTYDGRYDILVGSGGRFKDGVVLPELSVSYLARELAERYRASRQTKR